MLIKTFIGTAALPAIGKGFHSLVAAAVEEAEQAANRWLAERGQDAEVEVHVQTLIGNDVYHVITLVVRQEQPGS
jgi:hypothetical protein